jgi:hypothetical protein
MKGSRDMGRLLRVFFLGQGDRMADEHSPAEGVEPHLSFIQFMQTYSTPERNGFAAWMRLHNHDPFGHYAQATWQQWYQDYLGHPVTT